jgi:glycosyltransferase involved in cell wall biosynthesis
MKNQNYDLTVAICVFNAQEYILNTLQSLSHQTFGQFELLIVDDGSTDGSVEIINRFLLIHPFLSASLISLEKNYGTANARDLALRSVTTELMMFFDADDIAEPDMIEKLYGKIIANPDCIAVGCYCRYIDIDGNPLPGGLYLGPKTPEDFFAKALSGKLMLMTPPTLFRVNFALQAGGYRQGAGFPQGKIRYQDLSEDVDLWGRMADFYAEGKIMLVLPEVLFSYRKNTASLSGGKQQLFVMAQKLKYIKFNQKRRRAGQADMDFIDYWAQLGAFEKLKIWLTSHSSYFYRQAAFAYVRRHYLRSLYLLALSILLNPAYLLDKYKFNFRKTV